jgi:hypothetical protein
LIAPSPIASPLIDAMCDARGRPVDYIVNLLQLSMGIMGLPWRLARSSELALPADMRGQDRILTIAKAYGADRYINPPGGRKLYCQGDFAAANIELCFPDPTIRSPKGCPPRIQSPLGTKFEPTRSLGLD